MKPILILISGLIISLNLLNLSVPSAQAQEATDSSVTQKIKERLKETAGEDLTAIKEVLTEKQKLPRKKAYIGIIKAVNSQAIELDYKSQIYTVKLTDSTAIVKSSGQKALTLNDLKPNDFILALGFLLTDNQTFQASRILTLNQPEPPQARQFITGPIQVVDGNKITVNNKVLTISAKTELFIKDVAKPTAEDLELADNFFAIVTLDKNGDVNEVKTALSIPGKNNPASLEPTNSTQSAAPKATSSAEEK